MNLSINQRLAFIAFIFSLSALIASTLSTDSQNSRISSLVHEITVLELAEQIKNREELSLFDVRSKQEFNQFHIPTAVHVSNANLVIKGVNHENKIILYSETDSLALQGFFILKGRGLNNVFVLKGGVRNWYNRILYPFMPLNIPTSDQDIANRVKTLSNYFGGHPVFVDKGNPLDYYKNNGYDKTIIRSKLIRMGC